jgi:hypothetical protein
MSGCGLSSPVSGDTNAIGIPITKTPKSTKMYLSMRMCDHKAIYLFDAPYVRLGKILEIIGLLLIGGTVYSFIGMTESDLRWPIFWSCAAGALGIIIYRNYMKKRKKNI